MINQEHYLDVARRGMSDLNVEALGTRAQNVMRVVTFRLADQLFAIDANSVREIIEPGPITRIPAAPVHCDCLINVRGAVIPMADLRVLFSMPRSACDEHSRILVVEVTLEGDLLVIGLWADAVLDVTNVDRAEISAPPKVGMRFSPSFVAGVGRLDGEVFFVPSIASILEMERARERDVSPT